MWHARAHEADGPDHGSGLRERGCGWSYWPGARDMGARAPRITAHAEFSGRLYDAGFHDVVNIDLSSVVVAQQRERHGGCAGMTCARGRGRALACLVV